MNDSEFYDKDSKKYDRITRILDYFQAPDLIDWKLKVGRKEAKRLSNVAMKIGTEVDTAIKADVQGLKIPKLKSQEAKNCWEAWLQWKKDYNPGNLIAVAETVFEDNLMVAGTPDLILDGAIIDIKCSSEIRASYWLQTEFYSHCISFGDYYKAILRLDKNLGIYEYKKMPLSESDWEVCRALITAYRYFNKPVKDGKEEVCQQH